MAAPTVRASASSTNQTVALATIGPSAPQDGDLLLAFWCDSSVSADTITTAGSDWDFIAGVKSPLGGIPGNRNIQIALASRTWRTGDPTTVTPFGNPTRSNLELRVSIIAGGGYVEAVTSSGFGGTAETAALGFVALAEAWVLAAFAYPRSTASGGQNVANLLPNPPFTGGNAIGNGFNNMMGHRRSGSFNTAALGPYQTSAFNDAWVTVLVAVMGRAPSADRIRSHVSEDAGSLFQATQAVAVELGLSEAFEYGTGIPPGALRAYHEALTPELVAVQYRPLPTRNQEMLVTVEGETNLGRMAGTYPSAIMTRVEDIPGHGSETATAQEAIQHIFDAWANEFTWFVPEPVPDLRLLVPEAVAAPRQHYLDDPEAGVLTTRVISVPQEEAERRTMREIADEWLEIFPGTTLRQDSSGRIELVPRVGPDAPDTPLALTWRDLKGISDGEDDPRGVINRARVVSQGWAYEADQALLAPQVTVFRFSMSLDRDVLESEDVLPDAEELAPYSVAGWTAIVAPGTSVSLSVTITAYGSHSKTVAASFSTEGTVSDTFDLDEPGDSHTVNVTHTTRGWSVTTGVRFERSSNGVLVIPPLPSQHLGYWDSVFGRTYVAYVIEITDASGEAWVKTNRSVAGEFGVPGNPEHTLPAAGGGDALAASRALYGERLATISSSQFQLEPEQAQAVARAHVLFNINPRTIRDVQQSEWDKYPVKFDHIGRLIELPNAEVAVVENRNYSDTFAASTAGMSSAFTATVTETVIDTSTEYLLLDDGDFMQLDDGSIAELN